MFSLLSRSNINDTLMVLFLLISSFIIFPNEIRFALMIGIAVLSVVFFILNLCEMKRIKKYFLFLILYLIFLGCHTIIIEPLTNYAENKIIYFYFTVFVAMFLSYFSGVHLGKYNILYYGLFLVGFSYFLISVGFKPSEENVRVSELGLNPLILARNIGIMGIIALFFVNKKISLLFFCLSLFGVMITGSRGPFFIMIIIFVIKMFWDREYLSIFLFTLFLFFIFVFFDIFLSFFPSHFVDRLTLDALKYQMETDASGDRLNLFKLAISLWKDNIWFGVGLGNYSFYAPLNAPHNIYLEILVEFGLFNAIIFYIFVFFSVLCGFKCMRLDANNHKLKAIFFVYIFFILSMCIDGELTIQSFLVYYLGLVFFSIAFQKR